MICRSRLNFVIFFGQQSIPCLIIFHDVRNDLKIGNLEYKNNQSNCTISQNQPTEIFGFLAIWKITLTCIKINVYLNGLYSHQDKATKLKNRCQSSH